MPNPMDVQGYGDDDGTRRTYEIDAVTITYDATKKNGSAQAGVNLAVTLSGNGIVKLAEDGEEIEGELISVESDGKCHVKHKGCVVLLKGDAAALTVGKKVVGDLGAASAKGYVREVNTATAAELGRCRGRVIDASHSTKVVVDLS